jgi:NADPH2:quinone reductase
MKAVRFHQTGGPEVLVYEDVPDLSPKEGEVLIKIEAIGLNYADIMRRRGDPYPVPSPTPFTLGVEIAGTIAALGEGVTTFEVGASVFATPGDGGYAQYICLPAATVIPLPPGLSAVQAAALVAHGLTAAIALQKSAKIQPGETVLVEAAAGGLGSFSVQLAKLYGAGKVIAAASTPEKRAIAQSLGADASVDYTAPGWVEKVKELTDGKGVDIVLETIGGEIAEQALLAMADFGRMIFIGQSSGENVAIDLWKLTVPNQTITGLYIMPYAAMPGLIMTMLTELFGFIGAGKLSIQVGKVLPLSQAAEAHRLLEGRQTTGKVVLQPWA